MQHFPEPLPREESDALVDRIEVILEQHGCGFWAVELVGVGPWLCNRGGPWPR
jgi:ribosomal-protein-alanine N-acetyltransferase